MDEAPPAAQVREADEPAPGAAVPRTRPPSRWTARREVRFLDAGGRLASRHPRLRRALLASVWAPYLVVDALLPGRRVLPLAALMTGATLLDSAATYLWLTQRIAVEGNPLVDQLMGAVGIGPGLALRAALSAALIVLLTLLARWHWEARAGMLVAAVALGAITIVHAYGLMVLLAWPAV